MMSIVGKKIRKQIGREAQSNVKEKSGHRVTQKKRNEEGWTVRFEERDSRETRIFPH